jgi:hypothetical protein
LDARSIDCTGFDNLRNVRVRECGEPLCFRAKTCELSLGCRQPVKDLYRNSANRVTLFRFIHDAHATAGQAM